MKRPLHHSDDSREHDAVWKLLDQAPPPVAGPRFADDTVRAARLAGQCRQPWWSRLLRPAPLMAGLAATAAVIALVVLPPERPAGPDIATTHPAAESQASQFAALQEIADAELLSSAADQPEAFSDLELVSLIGF